MATVDRSGRSARGLRTVGRLTLYASYLGIWVLIWGPATVLAFGRNDALKTAVGAILLVVPLFVIAGVLLRRRTS